MFVMIVPDGRAWAFPGIVTQATLQIYTRTRYPRRPERIEFVRAPTVDGVHVPGDPLRAFVCPHWGMAEVNLTGSIVLSLLGALTQPYGGPIMITTWPELSDLDPADYAHVMRVHRVVDAALNRRNGHQPGGIATTAGDVRQLAARIMRMAHRRVPRDVCVKVTERE